MRLIDADALIEATQHGCVIRRKDVEDAPTVDAEPVRHGRWIAMQEDYGDVYYVCSECNEAWFLSDGTPVDNNMHYCTRCGARMHLCYDTGDERPMSGQAFNPD